MGHSIRTTRFRYTEWGEGEFGTELYDYDTDPGEYTNLSGDPSQAAILTKMKQLLDKALNRASAPAH
jgi:arylsulfatase A-like enzyme